MHASFEDYIAALQEATTWSGVSAFCQANRHVIPHERTVRRWHRRLGPSLVVSPRFAIDALGLSHLHAFLAHPCEGWERLPYIIDYTWVTTDCTDRLLYVHCVVPSQHEGWLRQELQGIAHVIEDCSCSTGWERTMTCTVDCLPPVTTHPRGADSLLGDMPMVVPAIFESWDRTMSLDGTWRRMKDRLGTGVRAYLRGQRYYATNGKLYVKEAFERLSSNGLFVQHAVRYVPTQESIGALVVVDRVAASDFLEAVRRECLSIAVHPGRDDCVVRVSGGVGLFDAILSAGRHRVYWIDRALTASCQARVRFAYDELFHPGSGEWITPEARQ